MFVYSVSLVDAYPEAWASWGVAGYVVGYFSIPLSIDRYRYSLYLSPQGEIDQHSPNFGVQTQTQKSLGLLGCLGHQGEHRAQQKKSWKRCKTSKEPARNSLIQIDWNSRDGGKGKQY